MRFSVGQLLGVIAVMSAGFGAASWVGYHPPLQLVLVASALMVSLMLLIPKRWLLFLVFLPFGLLLAYFGGLVLLMGPLYFEEFNTITSRLESMPGVEVVDSWYNDDISLEDPIFWFRVNGGPTHSIGFWDGNEWIGLFESIDGVVVEEPRYSQHCRYFSTEVLRENGMNVEDLEDAILQCDAILALPEEESQLAVPESTKGWVHFFPNDEPWK